ncbi:MAG TPA: vitamin K epoxide reductase family protein [Candidatus Saccharimonadales bacterium]|nr:vitamin K epoxide reductase family protein [Candidatus Saccharimonadales bacterium]
MIKPRTIYGIMTTGGVIGAIAAFLQTTEKIQLLKNKDAILACDLGSIFSCSDVLSAWQSSVFGFPNSLMCMTLFTIFAATALVGLSGGVLPKKLRLSIHALSLFTLGFALWFLTQSIYVINALCILCIFCFVGLLLVNWSWLRLNAADLPIGERGRALIKRLVARDIDTLAWILLTLAMALAMFTRFY